jgi:hypothetical protein
MFNCFLPAAGFRDLGVPNQQATTGGAGSVTMTTTPMGPAALTATNAYIKVPSLGTRFTSDGTNLRPATIRIIFAAASWSGTYSALFEKAESESTRDAIVNVNTSGNITYNTGGGNNSTTTSVSTGMTAGVLWDYCWTYESSGELMRHYVNGRFVAQNGLTNVSDSVSTADLWLGGKTAGGGSTAVSVAVVLCQSWPGIKLSDAEVTELYADPFGMFDAREPRHYTFLNAPASDGSATVTPAVIGTTTTHHGQSTKGGAVATPALLATTTTHHAETATGGATVSAAVLATTTAHHAATAAGAGTVSPAVLATTTTMHDETVASGSDSPALVQPGVLATTTAFPDESVAGGATVTPDSLATTTSLPRPATRVTDVEATPEEWQMFRRSGPGGRPRRQQIPPVG